MFVFWGFSIRLQPTPLDGYLRKIRQMTSFRVRKCLFEVPMTLFYIWTLKFPKSRHFGTDFDWTVFLRPKTALTWGCSNIKRGQGFQKCGLFLPPVRGHVTRRMRSDCFR